jgi:hypothetical protein
MSNKEALSQPFAKSLGRYNNQLLIPQVYITKQSKELLSSYKAGDYLTYRHVIWINKASIIGNKLNNAIRETSVAISASVASIFLSASLCESGLRDNSECFLCDAKMLYLEACIVRDCQKKVQSRAEPLDGLLSYSYCQN